MKIIEVIADSGHHDTIKGIAEQQNVADIWFGAENEDGRISTRLLVAPENRQAVIDALQSVLSTAENAHIMIIPLEAALPKEDEGSETEKDRKKTASTITREEIMARVEKGAQLNSNYILLVLLSSVVAAIGLLENNVAVIIGAMVIAPLLGPNIAFSLGTALGESKLIGQSLTALFIGVALAILVSLGIGWFWPAGFDSYELMSRTDVQYSSTAIALASGAAASLSLVAGTSGVLVGVMVAVALMPPAVTIGLMLSAGEPGHALGAALLLAVNIVCINLSSKLVFLVKGIKPRTWLEARKVQQSRMMYIIIWIILLALLFVIIYLRHQTLAT